MNNTPRLILALVLSVVVLSISMFIQTKYFGRKAVVQPQEQQAAQAELKNKEGLGAAPYSIESPENAARTQKRKESITVETKLAKITFTPYGTINNWKLKEYKEGTRKGKIPANMLDLASGADTKFINYVYDVAAGKDKRMVLLTAKENGLSVIKEFVFEEDSYTAKLKYRITNNSTYPQDVSLFSWGPGIAEMADPRIITFVSCSGGKVSVHKAQKIKTTTRIPDALWCGITERYFALALLPQGREQSIFLKKGPTGIVLEAMAENIYPGATVTGELEIYAGPKDHAVLKKAGKNLELLINFGTFAPIAKVIYALLGLLYGLTKNYGVAIILVSVIIKVILFPLSRTSVKSMHNMQKLQPQLEALKQRFKNDQEALTRETMELYKRMKINPFGGCLPILLQLPVFFALYVVFQNSIELRQSPFIFWIRDLSAADPFFILPILMGVTTFIQQKMTTTASAGQPAGMQYFMTIFLTVIFLSFPSGLVLYWLTNNVLSLVEHRIVTKGT